MFNMEEAKKLLDELTRRERRESDELLSSLVQLLQQQLQREEKFHAHLNAQGLPESITLESFIQHHRSNAGFAATLQTYRELVLNYEPTSEELKAVTNAVYGPHEPAEWELENAREALIAANRARL